MAPNALSFSEGHVHTDNAVMPLMGKHMLDRGEFPIFYYGQDWFGSLPAVVHAAVFLTLGGIPPWSVHIPSLLFFLGWCVVLYLLARDTLGPTVALTALAWNIVTPVHLSEFANAPLANYVESLVLSTLLLWLAVRVVRARGARSQNGLYALLGFVGGLGWWTTPLVIYSLLAAAVYIVMRERIAAVVKGALISLPAFFVGMAPVFYFYATDSALLEGTDPYSRVLGMVGEHSWSDVPSGLLLLFSKRVPQYLDWDLLGATLPYGDWFAAAVYSSAMLFFLWRLRKSFDARNPLRDAAVFPIFFVIFSALFAASIHIRRDAPRYVIPLSAILPVALGFWLVHARRIWKVVAWAGCAGLFLFQGWTTASVVVSEAPRAEALMRRYLDLIHSLEARGVTLLYVTFPPGSELLDFYSGDRLTASRPVEERYAPNQLALERAADPAFLYYGGAAGLIPTLNVLRASYEVERLGSYDLVRHVREIERRYRQISPATIRASASHQPEAMTRTLDRDMESAWESGQRRTPGMWIQFDLGGPYNVGMVRLWNKGQHQGSYAMHLRIETSMDGRAWHEALPRSQPGFFYWSGPRVYPWEWGYRWEARFAPAEARFVRITQYEDEPHSHWMIAEAYLYEDLGPQALARAGEEDVLRRIRESGLTRVYADRWMSARVSESSRDAVETVIPFTFVEEVFYPRVKPRVVRWSRRLGFVLADSDADEFERLIREEDVHHLTREDIGRWVLFRVAAPAGSGEAGEGDVGWWWNGLGAVKTNHREKSRYLTMLAQDAYGAGQVERAAYLLKEAVDVYRWNRRARQLLVEALEKLGRGYEAAEQSRVLSDLTEPQVKASAEFRGTLELLGYTLGDAPAQPGREVNIRYFWKVKRDPGPDHTVGVFVHVENADGMFQSDFPFLNLHEEAGWPPLEDEVFIQDGQIKIPLSAAPGKYRIVLGVQDLRTGRRWNVSSGEHPTRRGRVPIGVLQVEPSPSG